MLTSNQSKTLPGIHIQEAGLTLREKVGFGFRKGSKNLVDFAKYCYLALVMMLLLCAVVELKHIYHIDIFPGVDTPIDNAYFAGKDQLGVNVL